MLGSLINQNLGRYTITALLGRGGMAAVYRAHDNVLQRDVAIKLLYPHYADEAAFVERFKREAITVAALEHPNIGPIYDVGEHDGMVYIAMKLLSGRTLQDVLNERGTLNVAEVLHILDQVASALDYAHTKGIVHRDIKPGNVMLEIPASANHETPLDQAVAMLTDFGIAKTLNAPGMTTTGALIGTPDYMAPEQIGNRHVDGRSDVYALAMLAYRALAGRPAFAGSTQDVLLAHLHDQPLAPSTFNPRLSSAVDAVLLKALAKNPDQRYPTAGAFVQALRQAQTTDATETCVAAPVQAAPDASFERAAAPVIASQQVPAQPARHFPVWLSLGATLLLLALAWGLTLAFFGGGSAGQSGNGRTPEATAPGGVIVPIETSATPTATLEQHDGASPTPTVETTIAPDAGSSDTPTATSEPVVTGTPPPAPTASPPPAASPTTLSPTREPTSTPTATPEPTSTPMATPEPTSTPTTTLNPTNTPTDIPTAARCPNEELLAGGFGLLYEKNVEVRVRLGCPTGMQVAGRAVVQFFEGGSMYWWELTDTIYVFLGVNGGRYRVVEAEENATYPEPTPDPDNPNAPVRGFGRIYAGIPEVRAALGTPLTPEIEIDGSDRYGVRQRFENGLMLFLPANTDPNNAGKQIFVLYNDDTFTRYEDAYPD